MDLTSTISEADKVISGDWDHCLSVPRDVCFSNCDDRTINQGVELAVAGMPFGWIGLTAKLAERNGIALRQSLIEAGVAPHIDDNTCLDPAAFLLMCTLVINEVDDEMHGIARTPMIRGTASMACKAMAAEKNLAGAIDVLGRFFRMVGSFCAIKLEVNGTSAIVKIRSDSADGQPGHVIEELMAHFLHFQFSYLIGLPLNLTCFVTRSSFHPFVNRCHPYLQCFTTFGRETALHFPAEVLAWECHAKVEEFPLWDAQKFWLKNHPAMGGQLSMGQETRNLSYSIYQMLQECNRSIEDCSHGLKMSVAELRRNLAIEGTNFRQVRRHAIVAKAKSYLESGVSTEDVADILGYSDSRSFRRAVKLAGGGSIQKLRTGDQVNGGFSHSTILEHLRQQSARMQ